MFSSKVAVFLSKICPPGATPAFVQYSVFSSSRFPLNSHLQHTTNHCTFVCNWASVYSTQRQGSGSLDPNPIGHSFRIACFFSQNHRPISNLEVLCKGQTIFKHEPFDVFAFKYVKIQNHLNCFSETCNVCPNQNLINAVWNDHQVICGKTVWMLNTN